MEQDTSENFPPKPPDEVEKDAWVRSLISIVLFAALYFMTFDRSPMYIVILVCVLLFHEMGHFIAMKQYGYKDVKMFFIPFFGAFVSGTKHEVSQKQRSIILLMGPVPGILLGCLFVLYCYFTTYDPRMMMTAKMLIWLNVFNLMPISPLDGGRLIENLFFTANRIVQLIFICISSLAFLGLAFYFESYLLCLLPVLLFSGLKRSDKVTNVRKRLDELQVNYKKPYEDLSDREYFFIRKEYLAEFDNGTGGQYELRNVKGVKGILQEETIHDLAAGGKAFFLFIWIFSIALSIGALLLDVRMYINYAYENSLFP